MNSDQQGPFRFDVFSDPGEVDAQARAAVASLREAAERVGGAEPRVLLPSARLALRAAEHILRSGLADNAMADLHLDKMTELSRALNRVSRCLELAKEGRGPEAVPELRGDVRLGYHSRVDDTDQPFCLFVPHDYQASRPYPVMVRLHGMWDQIDEAEWTIQTFEWDREFVRYSPRGSFLELYPYGRGNEGYREAGREDVLDTLDLVCELFNTDPDRVYLLGSSMGAAGAWRLAAQYGERFAAVCGVVGAYDQSLAPNVARLPVMFHYGGKDSAERVTSPQETAALLTSLGGVAEVVGHPESGHRLETTDYQLSYYQFFARHARKS